ncbi:MAG: tRNA (adenosine(37)-N6)-dimethylallyltransferase MiaA [Paracoccaceae bacterium]
MNDLRSILIAGPTASGKSTLALRLAEQTGSVVINADSQQVYAGWHILSARPSGDEEACAPHRLYGHVAMDADYSAGHWLRDVAQVLKDCAAADRHPIIVGGTGLYFKALTEGLAPIPPVPPEIRAEGEALLAKLGREDFALAFAACDPETARGMDLENPRRVLRAWEVLKASGTGLAAWQARTPPPLVALADCTPIALAPDRDWLYARCEARFDAMLKAGALEEVRAVMAMDLPEAAPSLRAVGAPELMAHLRGEMSLEAAAAAAKMETRRYAKRQMTWIRNQMGDWQRLDPSCAKSFNSVIGQFAKT